MPRIAVLLFLALILTCCATQPPPQAPAPPGPTVTYAMANLEFWPEEAQAVVRLAMQEVNQACGRELVRESNHTPMVTIHNKSLSFFEEELLNEAIGGTILGLADPPSRTFALYPQAFSSPDILRATTIHELFHVLGLTHNTTKEPSIMHPWLEQNEQISLSDIRALNRFGWQCHGSTI